MGREENSSSSELRKAKVGEAGALPPTGLAPKAVGVQEPNHGLGEQAAHPLCTQHGTEGVNCEVMNVSIN